MKPLMAALGALCLMIASPALAGTTRIETPREAAYAVAEAKTADLLAQAPARADPATATARLAPTSRLPEPATWAAMLAGFGIAGASLRRGRMYRLVEQYGDGTLHSEEFPAPDDDSALERALSVADGGVIEVWRGAELVRRLEPARHIHA